MNSADAGGETGNDESSLDQRGGALTEAEYRKLIRKRVLIIGAVGCSPLALFVVLGLAAIWLHRPGGESRRPQSLDEGARDATAAADLEQALLEAESLRSQGCTAEAISKLQSVIDRTQPPPDSGLGGTVHLLLGKLYATSGNPAAAEAAFRQAITRFEGRAGLRLEACAARAALACSLLSRARYDDVIVECREALRRLDCAGEASALAEASAPDMDEESLRLTVTSGLATAYLNLSRFDELVALDRAGAVGGRDLPPAVAADGAALWLAVAQGHIARGDLVRAEELVKRSVLAARTAEGAGPLRNLVWADVVLAQIEIERGQFAEAHRHFAAADASASRAELPARMQQQIRMYRTLLSLFAGNLVEAKHVIQDLLRRAEGEQPRDAQFVFTLRRCLLFSRAADGDLTDLDSLASGLLRDVRERRTGEESDAQLASDLQVFAQVALLETRAGRLQEATQLMTELRRVTSAPGNESRELRALLLNTEAAIRTAANDLPSAESLARDALALVTPGTSTNDRWAKAHAYFNLALILFKAGRLSEARTQLNELVAESADLLGRENPLLDEAQLALLELDRREGQSARALAKCDELLRKRFEFLQNNVVHAGEQETKDFISAQYRGYLDFGLALAAVGSPVDAKTAEVCAAWLINSKALESHTLQTRAALSRDRPECAALVAELQNVRDRIIGLRIQAAAGADRAEQLQAARRKEQAITRSLAERTASDTRLPWMTVDSLRNKLPSDSVLILLQKIPPDSFPLLDQAASHAVYVCSVILPAGDGPAQFFNLGPAEEIDRAVVELRGALETQTGGARASAAHSALQALSASLLAPLRGVCERRLHWYVSPSSSTWLVPWAALSGREGSFVVEQQVVTHLASPRSLLARTGEKVPLTRPMVIAAPDFDGPAAAPGGESAPAQAGAPKAAGDSAGYSVLPRNRWPPLPGAQAEGRAIAASVKQWLSQDPILLTGTQATKAALLAAESPPVLAICTHAYFRESPRPRRGASRDRSRGLRLLDPAMPADTHVVRLAKTGEEFSLDELLFRLENPLLRCGIVLAGANRTVGADGQDGIAVGQEIIGMNLQGTDLVLLSACQTAVGPMEGRGESLEGLAHAFQMAGAKSVVAALWSVPDRQTAELTAEMFQALAQGIPVSEALRRAEVQAIQRYRTGPAPPDPWYWAALIALER